MVLIMVVGVRKDRLVFVQEAADELRPPQQVIISVLLQMGVPRGELPPVAEPADVGEVRRCLLHCGHPRVGDERQGDAVLAEHLSEVRAEPAPVPHLDGVPEVPGKVFEEVFEDAYSFGSERRRQLYEERAEFVAEIGHRPYEVLGFAFGIDQVLIVGDLLRKLGGEEKSLGRDLAPLLYGRAAGGAVEGRVYLDGREPLDVLGEPRTRRYR